MIYCSMNYLSLWKEGMDENSRCSLENSLLICAFMKRWPTGHSRYRTARSMVLPHFFRSSSHFSSLLLIFPRFPLLSFAFSSLFLAFSGFPSTFPRFISLSLALPRSLPLLSLAFPHFLLWASIVLAVFNLVVRWLQATGEEENPRVRHQASVIWKNI